MVNGTSLSSPSISWPQWLVIGTILKGSNIATPVKSGSLKCNLKMPTLERENLYNCKPSIFGLERFNSGGCMPISATPWRVLWNSFHPKVPRALHRLTLSKSRSNSRAPAVGSFSAEAPKLEMQVKWDAKWRIYFGSSIFALYIMLDIISCHTYLIVWL